MTKEQTRQLGIEVERRIQLMYPPSELQEKIDTDTIYSLLNEYQDKYVKQLYLTTEQVQPDSKAISKINDVLSSLLKQESISLMRHASHIYNADAKPRHFIGPVPEDYFMYVRSYTETTKTYKGNGEGTLPNVMVKDKDINNIINSVYNKGGILRTPIVFIDDPHAINVITDDYTMPRALILTYYKKPCMFNVTSTLDSSDDANAILNYCELPFSCFDELVDGAVQLYVMTYKYGTALAAADRSDKSIKNGLRRITAKDDE